MNNKKELYKDRLSDYEYTLTLTWITNKDRKQLKKDIKDIKQLIKSIKE